MDRLPIAYHELWLVRDLRERSIEVILKFMEELCDGSTEEIAKGTESTISSSSHTDEQHYLGRRSEANSYFINLHRLEWMRFRYFLSGSIMDRDETLCHEPSIKCM